MLWVKAKNPSQYRELEWWEPSILDKPNWRLGPLTRNRLPCSSDHSVIYLESVWRGYWLIPQKKLCWFSGRNNLRLKFSLQIRLLVTDFSWVNCRPRVYRGTETGFELWTTVWQFFFFFISSFIIGERPETDSMTIELPRKCAASL